jgi:DinB superfamily
VDPQQVTRNSNGDMQCRQCGFRYNHSAHEVAELSKSGYESVREVVEATPPDRANVRPAPHVWSVNAYTAHLAEASGVVLSRVRLIATEDRPAIAWYDENESVERNRLDERETAASLVGLQSNVKEFAAYLRGLPDEAWERVGVHSRAGAVRLAEIAHDMAHELQHHADDIRAIGVEGRIPN